MAKSSHGGDSRKNPSRKMGKGKPHTGGMLDILAPAKTGYPELCSHRRLPGNGARPANPFGRKMKRPQAGRPVK